MRRGRGRGFRILFGGAVLAATATLAATDEPEPAAPPIADVLRAEAGRLEPFVVSPLAKAFLAATAQLPAASPRVLWRDPDDRRRFHSAAAREALPEAERERLQQTDLDAAQFYTTRYGSPLAYCRALDIAARHGFTTFAERRVLDYGYGTIGHLRLMALNGAEAVGVDVDPFLQALYAAPEDQGQVPGGTGRVRLVHGFWPGTPEVGESVGAGYDLFLSKNTLKRGYVHPEREADPSRLLQLGVDDATYVGEVFRALRPGGLAVIYNLSPKPAPPDQPYIPWADGRFPFPREIVEAAGFEVLEFDVDDSEPARSMARLLGWDEARMKVDEDLFGHYTVLRRPADRAR